MSGIFITSIEFGLLFAPVALGIFLTFRVLNFPDLTVEGSFVAGAVVSVIAVRAGIPGLAAILFGLIAGFFAGSLTAFLHIKLGIEKILASVLSLGMLYTINLRLMGTPNLSLFNRENVIWAFKSSINHLQAILLLAIIVLAVKFFVDWLLNTEIGLRLRATGSSEAVAKSLAVNIDFMKFLGLALSNGLVGLSGALVAQYQGFADISIGQGVVVVGLASLMLGEAMISSKRIGFVTLGAIAGSILYQFIVNFALRLGLVGTDLKFVAASIVVVAILFGNRKSLLWKKNF